MAVITDPEKIKEVLDRSIDKIYPSREHFERALQSGRKLKIYLGIDPTSPHLHIGNAVSILVLRKLQELGHEIILLIGDFTAMIGDPTDKSSARQPLTAKQVKDNLRNYKKQVSGVLGFSGSNPVKIGFNSKWLGNMKFKDVLELASHFTVQQMLQRDMFQDRLKNEKPIGLHEFLYPLMQGYDSVVMDVDAEIGGTDQTFNMLAGRDLMRSLKNKEKFVLTVKLLVNPVTGKKMSKSEGEVINLDDSPKDMFGKVMANSDEMMMGIMEMTTLASTAEVEQVREMSKSNPRDAKAQVAHWVVRTYYGEKAADEAEEEFDKVFRSKEMPTEIKIFKVPNKSMNIVDLLVAVEFASSKGEARRLIEQGGVKLDEHKILDHAKTIEISSEGHVLQVGKRHFMKIVA